MAGKSSFEQRIQNLTESIPHEAVSAKNKDVQGVALTVLDEMRRQMTQFNIEHAVEQPEQRPLRVGDIHGNIYSLSQDDAVEPPTIDAPDLKSFDRGQMNQFSIEHAMEQPDIASLKVKDIHGNTYFPSQEIVDAKLPERKSYTSFAIVMPTSLESVRGQDEEALDGKLKESLQLVSHDLSPRGKEFLQNVMSSGVGYTTHYEGEYFTARAGNFKDAQFALSDSDFDAIDMFLERQGMSLVIGSPEHEGRVVFGVLGNDNKAYQMADSECETRVELLRDVDGPDLSNRGPVNGSDKTVDADDKDKHKDDEDFGF